MKKNLILTAVAAAMAGLGGAANAAVIVDYPDFSSSAGLTLVGNANITSVPGELQLTPPTFNQAGAAYSTSAITLGAGNTFSTQFQFRLNSAGGINPADGMTFVMAANPTGLGGFGGGLGYQGVLNSVAVEFDTYNNGGFDGNSSNHVGVNVNGSLTSSSLSYVYGRQTCDFAAATFYTANGCLGNGHVWTATISYDGTSLNASLLDSALGFTYQAITNYAINVGSILGTNSAYVGFTAATGSGFERHNILNWRFADTATLPPTTPVPEPATLGLLGIGLLASAFVRRRKTA